MLTSQFCSILMMDSDRKICQLLPVVIKTTYLLQGAGDSIHSAESGKNFPCIFSIVLALGLTGGNSRPYQFSTL